MTFLESIKHCFSNYGNFKGRGKRSEYWYFQLFAFIVYFIAMLLSPVLYIVAILGLFIPTLAAGIRRLHDGGRSGWSLLWAFVPFGAFFILFWLASEGNAKGEKYN